MEHLSDSEKAAHAEGMRAATNQTVDTFKVVALLRALGDDIPNNVSINGSDLHRLVIDLESKGIVFPGKPVGDAEVRSLRSKVTQEISSVSLRGIPYKGKAPSPTYKYDPDEALRMKAKFQEQTYEFLLLQEGDSREKIDERLEEAKDPLMKLVKKRQGK